MDRLEGTLNGQRRLRETEKKTFFSFAYLFVYFCEYIYFGWRFRSVETKR